MSLSTLRPLVPPASLTSLTDDSLLVLLSNLTLPQLLTHLSVCRRLHHLIVGSLLSSYRSISIPSIFAWEKDTPRLRVIISRHFTASPDSYQTTGSFTFRNPTQIEGAPAPWRLQDEYHPSLGSFPSHLPTILPGIESLIFVYFIYEDIQLSAEQTHINGLTATYLSSSGWSQTLVYLELWLQLDAHQVQLRPEPSKAIFNQLNDLAALRHLILRSYLASSTNWHTVPEWPVYLLPDSMPVLGQLEGFSLYAYTGANVPTLLHQLAPNLSFLSLLDVHCSARDFTAFLSCRPAYRQSLETLDLHLVNENKSWTTPSLGTLVEHCASLKFLSCSFPEEPSNLFTFFGDLSRLSLLEEMGYFRVNVLQLRALSSHYPLPRLTSLRRVCLSISCPIMEWAAFQSDELFNQILPLLGGIFCAVEQIEIQFQDLPRMGFLPCATLSERLRAKMVQHFPGARTCLGEYRACPFGVDE